MVRFCFGDVFAGSVYVGGVGGVDRANVDVNGDDNHAVVVDDCGLRFAVDVPVGR